MVFASLKPFTIESLRLLLHFVQSALRSIFTPWSPTRLRSRAGVQICFLDKSFVRMPDELILTSPLTIVKKNLEIF